MSASPTTPDPGSESAVVGAAAASGGPRVLVIDDHALVRSGVRSQLTGHVRIVGEADDVAPAVVAVVELLPDVVLLDVHLPSGSGADVIAGVGDRAPGTRWLALSVSDSPEDVVKVIRAGAHGYLTKSVSAADLVDAVHRVAAGGCRVLTSTGGVRPGLVPRASPGTDGSGVEPAGTRPGPRRPHDP